MSSNTKKNLIIDRIIQLRVKHFGKRGKSDFARKLNISPSTYNYYEQDRVPPADILLKMCKATNVSLEWLIAGENIFANTSKKSGSAEPKSDLAKAVDALAAKNSKIERAISAFVEIICEKNNIKNPLSEHEKKQNLSDSNIKATNSNQPSHPNNENICCSDLEQKTKAKNSLLNEKQMIPVLGRTAAGIVHCWDQYAEPDSWQAETKLAELVKKHIGKDIICSNSSKVEIDNTPGHLTGGLNTDAYIVQVNADNDGPVEFIDSSEIAEKYPDCFGLVVDGDSMQPMLSDGDIVILSPSVPAKQGSAAVAKVRDQIGVTCKIIRFDDQKVHLVASNENYETKVIEKENLIWALAVIAHVRKR